MPFAGDSKLMMSNGKMLNLTSVFVSEGTVPAGSTWQMMPIPMGHDYCGSNPGCKTNGHPFPPPCGEENDPCGASGKENGCKGLAQGLCSGEWCAAVSCLLRLEACGRDSENSCRAG